MSSYQRIAIEEMMEMIRNGRRMITATEVQDHLLICAMVNCDPLRKAAARQVAVVTLQQFASIGLGIYIKGTRGHKTRLEQIP